MNEVFPINVFEDVKPQEFSKHNKKGVTEDFVTENFKELGWKCFRPLDDSGVDLVVRREVCPKNHTRWNDVIDGKCGKCGEDLITITRFVQIKAREEEDDDRSIGITLSSKDFRGDPRHVFLIYADAKTDFFVIPIYRYLRIFKENEIAQKFFGVPAFRRGNHRVYFKETVNNVPHYASKDQKRYCFGPNGSGDLTKFMNDVGLEIMSDPEIENDFVSFCEKTSKIKFDILHDYSPGRELDFLLQLKSVDKKIKEKESLWKKKKLEYSKAKKGSKKRTLAYKVKNKASQEKKKAEQSKKIKKEQLLTKYKSHYKKFLEMKSKKIPREIVTMRDENRKKFVNHNEKSSIEKVRENWDTKTKTSLKKSINDFWKLYKGQEQL